MINFDRVDDALFIGSAPQTSVDVARLVQMKVTAVLSLQSDADLNAYRMDGGKLQTVYEQNSVHFQRFPIIDFDEQDLGQKLPQPVNALRRLLEHGHQVYVHCNAGICRAPATVLTYLCHNKGMTIAQGLAFIRRQRPQANPYVGAVERALTELEKVES